MQDSTTPQKRIYINKCMHFTVFFISLSDSLIWKLEKSCKSNEILVKTLTEFVPKTHHHGSRNIFFVRGTMTLHPLEYFLTLSFIWALTAMHTRNRHIIQSIVTCFPPSFSLITDNTYMALQATFKNVGITWLHVNYLHWNSLSTTTLLVRTF